jgi:hypothetical protein
MPAHPARMRLTDLVACCSLLRGRANERSAALVFIAHLTSRARCPGRLPRLRSGEWQQHGSSTSKRGHPPPSAPRTATRQEADGHARVRNALQTHAAAECAHTIRAHRGDLGCAAGRRHPSPPPITPFSHLSNSLPTSFPSLSYTCTAKKTLSKNTHQGVFLAEFP